MEPSGTPGAMSPGQESPRIFRFCSMAPDTCIFWSGVRSFGFYPYRLPSPPSDFGSIPAQALCPLTLALSSPTLSAF